MAAVNGGLKGPCAALVCGGGGSNSVSGLRVIALRGGFFLPRIAANLAAGMGSGGVGGVPGAEETFACQNGGGGGGGGGIGGEV